MKQVLTILCILVLSVSAFAQTPKQWAKYGNEAFRENDFYGAAYYFRKAVNTDSTYLEGYWMLAESYRNYNHYVPALQAYEYVIKNDLDNTYFLAEFYAALMSKNLEQYAIAKQGFEHYTKAYRSKSSKFYKRAKQEIKSCEFAISNKTDSISVVIEHTQQPINTFNGEISPWLTNDSTWFFSSLRHSDTSNNTIEKEEYHKVFKQNTDTFQLITLLDSLSNYHVANVVFSSLRPRIYFTLCQESKCKIYYQDSTMHGELEPPVHIEALDLAGYTATQPFPTIWNKQEVLLFASDRPRGKGKMDLWYSVIKDGNKFSRPKNLGKTINSPENEITPFYDTTAQTLYFSSVWHPGFGGYDIQKSTGSATSWSEPENIGLPLNSSANDLYYKQNDSLQIAYWVSNRTGSFSRKGEHCCNDIYTAQLSPQNIELLLDTPAIQTPDTPLISNTKPQVIKPVVIYFENDQPNPKSWSTNSTMHLADLVSSYNTFLSSSKLTNIDTTLDEFIARQINPAITRLDTLIQQVAERISAGDTVSITLSGFASPLAKTAYNLNLSKRRIHVVEQYLLAHHQLQKGLENKQLHFSYLPQGEIESIGKISDDRTNKAESVYSLNAMKARRVEVLVKLKKK